MNRLIHDDKSVSESTNNTFAEKDFRLPELEVQIGMDLNDILLHDKHKKQFQKIRKEITRENLCLTRLDKLAHQADNLLSTRASKGAQLSTTAARKLRVKLECEAELATIRQIVTRKPGELVDKLKEMKEQIEQESLNGIDDDNRESSIDHPALDSVHEKMEDLRQEACEKWCVLHGKKINEKYTNLEKRMLRKWFKELDYDGSGEVSVEELQDPMLSSGILKTREQVVRVLANVDRNGTMGIDFEEFLVALSANKLADKHKLKRLQEMSAHPHFSVDTLITEERRRKLFKSILKQSQTRQAEIDALYKKYDKPKLSKKEREAWVRELELLEERQARSVSLHLKYLQALDGVLEDKKGFYAMQRADQLRELEESRAPDALDALMNRPGHQLAVAEQRRVAGDTTSVAGGDLQAAETWHQRHHVHHHSHGHHHDNMSVSSYHSQPGRSPAKDDAERLHNPYSIYAPPPPKYNKK
jgi:Ca2+-binding EF-hand superfamily protein